MARKIDPENPTRLAILAACRANPNATVRGLAAKVGVATVTVNYHLRKLEADGLIKRMHNDKANKLSNSEIDARIDDVVKKAQQRESKTQHDVIRHINRPLNLRKGGYRIG